MNDTAERNVLSGNLFAGVWITGQGTSGNAVAGNFIGTDITGSIALNNGTRPVTDSLGDIFGGGVAISAGASGNRIGTDGKSVDNVGERNVIAGSNNDGIDIYGTGTDRQHRSGQLHRDRRDRNIVPWASLATASSSPKVPRRTGSGSIPTVARPPIRAM